MHPAQMTTRRNEVMKNKNISLAGSIVFSLLALAFMSAQPAQAQVRSVHDPKPSGPIKAENKVPKQIGQSVPRFSGNGKARATARVNLTALQMKTMPNRKLPPPLSFQEKQQVLDAKVGTTYVTLTPGHMSEAGKAKIEAWSPVLVNSEIGFDNPPPHISFPPLEDATAEYQVFAPPLLWIEINSQATGSYYLVDCSVTPGTYTILASDGNTQTMTVADNKHLLFHLDQADKGWHAFTVKSDTQWAFVSCEIIRLN